MVMIDMSDMNLSAIDLNLLVVLDAVLETGSATRAAARLHVTQSAVSNALRRARELFDDPLVVRTGRGLSPTPVAEALAGPLRDTLAQVRGLLGAEARFDPATSMRRFQIACSDAVGLVLLPKLLARFEAELPNATLQIVTLDRLLELGGLAHTNVDLLIGAPPTTPPGCEEQLLFADPMVSIVRARHPGVSRRLTLARYCALAHAEVALFGTPDDRVDRALARHGRTRRIEVGVSHIAMLPALVANSDCVATVTKSMVELFGPSLKLRVFNPPVELEPLPIRQIWHRRVTDDPGTTMLRELVRLAAADLGSR
jgi:DNA-binding transcriptional LysR family regulator